MSGWNNLYDMFTPPKLSGKEWLISIAAGILILVLGVSGLTWVQNKMDPPEARQKREIEQKQRELDRLKKGLGQ